MHEAWEWVKRRLRKPETPMEYWIRVADTVSIITKVIFIGSMGVSYLTQVDHLSLVTTLAGAYAIPLMIDLLAYGSAKTLHLRGAGKLLYVVAAVALLSSVSWSVTFNVMGVTDGWAIAAHVVPVALYLAGELLSQLVGAHAARLRAEEARKVQARMSRTANDELRARIVELESEIAKRPPLVATPAKRPVKTPKPLTIKELDRPGFPVAPTSGGPMGERGHYGPRDPLKGYSKRQLSRIAKRQREAAEAAEVS